MRTPICIAFLIGAMALAGACSSDDVSSEDDARHAYLGLHRMVDRALNMGMAGYNAASSANIPAQEREGDVAGTITISGQVDQGSSDNKGMRLDVELVEYRDEILVEGDLDAGIGVEITYGNDPEEAELPFLELKLRNIPNGTFTGELRGTFLMTGDLEGRVTLDLELSGTIEQVPGTDDDIRRVPGDTTVTGTADSRYGTFEVDFVI